MKDLITKNSDGSFQLTSDGEQEAYFSATRKLIEYYLQQILKKDKIEIGEKINNLPAFIFNNFRTIDDYLNKLPDLSTYINEGNVERFQKFMGQHFVQTLLKEKNILVNKEMARSADKLDNPFWTPSYALLKKFGNDFKNARVLKFPPENDNDINIETHGEKIEIIEEKKDFTIIDLEPPGSYFLRKYGSIFSSSPKIKIMDLFSESEDENDINENNVHTNVNIRDENIENIFENSPGKIFLEKFRQDFLKCPRLEMDSGILEKKNAISAKNKLFSIKSFASLLGKISKFTKNKDNAGYQEWFKSLSNIQKAAIKINSLYNAERKGSIIDWGKEIMLLSVSLNENKQDIYTLCSEIKLYVKIITIIKNLLSKLNGSVLTPVDISNIYAQSIQILDRNGDLHEKKSSVKILMLQVTDEKERGHLLSEYDRIIEALR